MLLTDNFNDTMAAPTFSSGADPGLTVAESGGHVDFTFAATVAAASYAYYASATTYTANGLCVAIEVSQVPANGGAAFFKLVSGTSELEFFASNGMLELRTRDPTLMTRKTVTLDLGAQRFWRIRQQGGTSYWDTAPDGVTYVEQTAVAGVFTPATASITFGAGAASAVNNGGIARFEGIEARD